MKCKRIGLAVDVQKYELGKNIEDGFALWTDIITQGFIVTDSLIKVTQEDGKIVCPFVQNRRGNIFIGEGDYVIVDSDGSKHVCGEDKIWKRYEKLDE